MSRFASKTKVSVDQTRNEIERVLTRYGATAFAYMTREGSAAIAFEAAGRRIRISMNLPADPQETRQRWRALLLVIKAKLESVESGIETLEEAFFGSILLPSGQTVYEATRQQVALAYETGRVQALLPDYSTKN